MLLTIQEQLCKRKSSLVSCDSSGRSFSATNATSRELVHEQERFVRGADTPKLLGAEEAGCDHDQQSGLPPCPSSSSKPRHAKPHHFPVVEAGNLCGVTISPTAL